MPQVQIGAITIRKKGKFEQPRTYSGASSSDVQRQTPPVQQQPPVQQSVSHGQQPAPEPKRKKTGLVAAVAAACVVVALFAGVCIFGMSLKNGDTIYPNVYVAGIDVGGMTREEAVDAVGDAVAASYSSATLQVQLPDRTIEFNPAQTNVALDADEAIEEALHYGRDGSIFSALSSYLSARGTEHYIDLQTALNLDTEYIRQRISEVAAEVEQQPQPSQVSYDQNRGTLTVDIGYPYLDLDTEGLYQAVYGAFMSGTFEPLSWDYAETPCDLVDLTPYYETYCTEMVNASYDETTKTFTEDVPGYGFDLEAANQKLALAAAGSQVVIQLEDIAPEVTLLDLQTQMFGTKLHTVSSKYVNNSNRTTNLRLACEAINGTILNPGDVFSFNDVVGERTAEKGYLAATVYVGGGASAQELGGGVCQVASTIYYGTLFLDVEQVHREPHMYLVTYVNPGMDATVYWGSIDYKFKNTLEQPIKIQANVDNGSVNITFWGSEPLEKRVEMSYAILETYPWEEVEELDETKPVGYREEAVSPYTGYKVVTYKTVYDLDGNVISEKKQEALSTYRKRDKKYIVGPSEDIYDNPFDDPFYDEPFDNPFDDEDDEPTSDPNTGTDDPLGGA